jgi:hypothetical protein
VRIRIPDADDPDFDAMLGEQVIRRGNCLSVRADDVGCDMTKVGAGHQVLQSVEAIIEVMIAQRVDVEAHGILGFDRGDILEKARERWGCAEGIPGGHD